MLRRATVGLFLRAVSAGRLRTFRLHAAVASSASFPQPPLLVDIGKPDDLLLSDFDHSDLLGSVSQQLGVKYLEECPAVIGDKVSGKLMGRAYRMFVAMPVTFLKRTRMVVFLYDTGAGTTFLSQKAYDSFGFDSIPGVLQVHINGRVTGGVIVSPPKPPEHSGVIDISEINILGQDFLKEVGADVETSYRDGTFSIHFTVAPTLQA